MKNIVFKNLIEDSLKAKKELISISHLLLHSHSVSKCSNNLIESADASISLIPWNEDPFI